MTKAHKNLTKIITDFIWTFLISISFFYNIDLEPVFYLCFVIGIWILLLLQYHTSKNYNFYSKAVTVFCSNFFAFILCKCLHGYRLLFDLEDVFCFTYSIYLISFCIRLLLNFKNKTSIPHPQKKILFPERKCDLERLINYVKNYSIIGINSPWGSGKSFLVDQIENSDNIHLIKIDLLSCNLDEIQGILLNELDKFLKENGIFSAFSQKLLKLLRQNNFIHNISHLLITDDLAYSETIVGFREDLGKLRQTIIIVFEDLDRIENTDIIKKILGISEKIAGKNIKIIYQYDEKNLKAKHFDRAYLEKYIPYLMNLTDISLTSILNYLFEENEFPINRSAFTFLETPTNFAFPNWELTSFRFASNIPNITIRKVDHFLKEAISCVNQKEIYRTNEREVILFFLIKHFFYDKYATLIPGKSLLDTFLFSYDNHTDNILYWVQYGCDKYNIKINEVFFKKENLFSAQIISLFQYQCDIKEIPKERIEIVNEPVANVEKRNQNEQKDRIIWNLLCNGKSEYTDKINIVNQLIKRVLTKPKNQQKKEFNKLMKDIYYRKNDTLPNDNRTIFLVGIPYMHSLFQACRVAGLTEKEWILFLDFYFANDVISSISPLLIENLNYCNINNKKLYLHILDKFNTLDISGNINSYTAYWSFLKNYLSALSTHGYIDTPETDLLPTTEISNVDYDLVINNTLHPLEEKIKNMKQKITIPQIIKEFDLILKFLAQNKNLIKKQKEVLPPNLKTHISSKSVKPNQTVFDQLNALDCDDTTFETEVLNRYQNHEITPYEIAQLDRFAQHPYSTKQ